MKIRKIIKDGEYRKKLNGREYTLKEVREIDFPDEISNGKLVTVPRIIEILKRETKDKTEKEILEEIFNV